jgi:hypothetical protein
MSLFFAMCLRLLFTLSQFAESGTQPSSSPLPEDHVTRNWGYLIDTSFHDGALHVSFGPAALLFAKYETRQMAYQVWVELLPSICLVICDLPVSLGPQIGKKRN